MPDCQTRRAEFEAADQELKQSILAEADAANTKAQADASATAAQLELDDAQQKVSSDAATADAAYNAYLDCVRRVDTPAQLPSRRA